MPEGFIRGFVSWKPPANNEQELLLGLAGSLGQFRCGWRLNDEHGISLLDNGH